MAEVWIPPMMQKRTGERQQVQVSGATVRQIVNNLEKEFPGIREYLCDGDEISPGIAVVVDGETTNLGMLEHVKEESEIHFLPAISGG